MMVRSPRSIHHDYIGWIEGFRQSLKGHIDGTFINFPNKLLVPNPDDPMDTPLALMGSPGSFSARS